MIAVKRADLDLGFTSPLDISMDSTRLVSDTPWVKAALTDGALASFEQVARAIL